MANVSSSVVAQIRPPASASALVRKLGALTLLSQEEIDFLDGLLVNNVKVPKKSDFIVEGEDFNATFVVLSGWAVRYSNLRDGRRQILSFALPGDILGLHVNFRRTASYSAAALSDIRLAAVEPMRVVEISQKYPVLASGLSWCTAREFSILGDQAVRLGRLSAEQRVAHLLLELWHRLRLIGEVEDNWITVPMTQRDIADTLGLSLVHTNRQLRTLERKKLITRKKDSIRLNYIDALSDLGEFEPTHLSEFRI